jgi:hypothetical protein
LFRLKKTPNVERPTSEVFATKRSTFNGEWVAVAAARSLRPLAAPTNVGNNPKPFYAIFAPIVFT